MSQGCSESNTNINHPILRRDRNLLDPGTAEANKFSIGLRLTIVFAILPIIFMIDELIIWSLKH